MYRNTDEKRKEGIRCHICTGCGRCPGVVRQIEVVTHKMEGLQVNLQNEGRERLVTVDVGTTTIAMQLHREDGSVEDSFVLVNPQTGYGADVLARIQAARKEENALEMQRMVWGALEKGVVRFQKRLSQEEKLRMVLAANTTMVYLLMGWNPMELGEAPFLASKLDAVETQIAGIPCFILPGLSAFVGGDIVAGIHACGMLESEKLTLLIDLGTNGELVLGNKEKLLACATAAGPAFEGGVNKGVWGADMIRLIAGMRKEGLLDASGLIADPYFDAGVRIGDVCVTQEAVRAIQLAKGAIAAGIQILLQKYGVEACDVEKVVLAGGFGYYLSPKAAAEIGLLPWELISKTIAGGNTALAGALYWGSNILQKGTAVSSAPIWLDKEPKVEIINLAAQVDFEKCYIDALNF